MTTSTRPTPETLRDLIITYLRSKHVMQLCTVRNGQPWCCNVHFYADDNLNLYWCSLPTRRHSQEIADDPRVAAAVAVQADAGNPVIGIQVEGDATIVSHPATAIVQAFANHHGRSDDFAQKLITGAVPDTFYRLQPRLYVLFDKQSFPDDPRQEYRPQ